MGQIKAIAVLAVLAGSFTTAHAAKPEFQVSGGVGGGFPGNDTHRMGLFLTGRFRLLPEIPVALEVSAYLPYGVGAGLALDVYRGHGLRIHLPDLGVFIPFDPSFRIMHPEVPRGWDLTVGAGVEWLVPDSNVVLTLDWRAYLPDPTTVPFYYGGFATKFYTDSLIGGQLWFGLAFRF